MISFVFWLKIHWSLFLIVWLTITHHCSGNGFVPHRRQAIISGSAGPIHWRISVALEAEELTGEKDLHTADHGNYSMFLFIFIPFLLISCLSICCICVPYVLLYEWWDDYLIDKNWSNFLCFQLHLPSYNSWADELFDKKHFDWLCPFNKYLTKVLELTFGRIYVYNF